MKKHVEGAVDYVDETYLPYRPSLPKYTDDEDTPYLVKVPVPPDRVTLADFKNVLNKPNCKYFFKSMDDDFGVVKEEITDDGLNLPCFNGRVVSWYVPEGGRFSGGRRGL